MFRRSSRNVKNAVGDTSGIPAKLVTTSLKAESDVEDEGWDYDDEDTTNSEEGEDSDYGSSKPSFPLLS